MSFAGRLEEVSVPEVLHLLSWGEKTGKLTLRRGPAEGIVVVDRGRIVNAASNSPRELLGSVLLGRRLVSEETLIGALERQRCAEPPGTLGDTLVAMGALEPEALEAAVRQQVEHVMAEFLLWDSGVFRFEPMEIIGPGRVWGDHPAFRWRGFHAEQIVLEVVKRVDETRRRRQEYVAASGGSAPASVMTDGLRPDPFVPLRGRPASVRAIVAEMQAPPLVGEAIVAILRQARRLVRRSVLFIPTHRGLVGCGQFGVEVGGAPADEHVRGLVMPLDQSSVLADVAAKRGTYRGMLPLCFWNEFLVEQLGGVFPREVAVVPAIVDGQLVAVLYGDNVPSDAPIGPVSGLEAAMAEACARYARMLVTGDARDDGRSARTAAGAGSARTAG